MRLVCQFLIFILILQDVITKILSDNISFDEYYSFYVCLEAKFDRELNRHQEEISSD